MKGKSSNSLGRKGEEMAVAYLEAKGYTILEKNYFFERAEVDIVAFDGYKIIFIEVKTRSDTRYGRPEEYISDSKIERIFKAAEAWLYERKMDGTPVQFDVVSIIQNKNESPEVNHFEDAFRLFGNH